MQIHRLPLEHDAAAAADLRAECPGLGDVTELLARTASASPYLRDLMRREKAWLPDALRDPDAALAVELARDSDLAGLPSTLRQMKRRVALLVGLADLAGAWPLARVTGALTALADRAVDLCVHRLVEAEVRRGKLPDADRAGGMVVLAMGKMGAGELNYSSDIDLICLFDETRHEDWQEARAAFIRVTRKMASILSDVTAEGYVFRTDLRLRPDAAVTPVCISMGAAESYYESEGRTWERAAFIKARPCAGDIQAGERFLKTLTPFVWRKHLDFATIEDTHDMRARIRDHRSLHGPLRVEGHNMKLGRGGIREIEFFTQTRQLIAGGRDPSLRDRTTVGGLAALARAGWITEALAEELTTLYRAHREVEHRLQMIADQQTHIVPQDAEAITRIAHLSGEDPARFRDGLLERLARTETLTEPFFAPADAPEEPELGERGRSIVAGWLSYPALRSRRAQTIFRRLRPQLLGRLQRARQPEEALLALDGFLRGLPAGVQIFSLFEANPTLIDLIVDIASVAPDLALYLSRHSGVFDAVIGGQFFQPWPDAEGLRTDLAETLTRASDYESKLDAARRWMKEWHFRIGVHHLRGLADAGQVGRGYADLARAVVAALWPVVVEEFARRHGPPPGRGAVVVGMGSLGARRMHARSDIDLIVIYDAPDDLAVEGRALTPRTYYARLTQAMLTALTARTAEGSLYAADMRLRPSGRQGPLATSLAAFRNYQMEEAWTWEHLALTRAVPLAGPVALQEEVEQLRCEILRLRGWDERVPQDVADMRRRLATAKPALTDWDARNGPGRLMDLELLAQMTALQAAEGADTEIGAQLAALPTELRDADRLFWAVQAAARLLSASPLTPDDLGEGAKGFLRREAGVDGNLTGILETAAATVNRAFRKNLSQQGIATGTSGDA